MFLDPRGKYPIIRPWRGNTYGHSINWQQFTPPRLVAEEGFLLSNFRRVDIYNITLNKPTNVVVAY